jgi:hypothetical protein
VTEGARELENSRQCNFLFETQKIIEDMTHKITRNHTDKTTLLNSNLNKKTVFYTCIAAGGTYVNFVTLYRSTLTRRFHGRASVR